MLDSEGEGVFEFGEDGSDEIVKRVRKFEREDASKGWRSNHYISKILTFASRELIGLHTQI